MKRSAAAWGGMMLTLVASTTLAQETTITGDDVDAILAAAKQIGTAELNESGTDPRIDGVLDGINYHIYFRNCTDGANCEDLNFYVGFLDIKPELDRINEWNQTKRFSRAYLDGDEDACVEMDIDLVQGVSEQYLTSQFQLWTLVMKQYAEFVGFRPANS